MLEKDFLTQIEQSSPLEGLKLITQAFPTGVKFSTSLGQEDQVLTDLIFKNDLPVEVFTLDTGRLFYEHYELLAKNKSLYKKPIKLYFPESSRVEEYVEQHGINGFYHSVENRKACCHIRKVEPLSRALKDTKVWITGLRREQSENREQMPVVEWDEGRQLYKFNPLLNWTYQDVLDYLQKNKVPELSLHKEGYISVGCQPCTRKIMEGENPRAGRWWWENSHKECGLHS